MSKKNTDLVVKTNRLIRAFQSLSVAENRLLQLAIVDARESGKGLSAEKPLEISATRYAERFDVSWERAYAILRGAEEKLWNREFTIIDEDYNNEEVTHRWIQSKLKYLKPYGTIKITLTHAVVREITRIDGVEDFFTSYYIEQTSQFDSQYSIRLYELLISWVNFKGDIPMFELEKFRYQLGLGANEYKAMNNFKKRVLNKAVDEINQYSDLQVSYEQVKRGRTIIGFRFVVKRKKQENKLDKSSKSERKKDVKTNPYDITEKEITALLNNKGFMNDNAPIGESNISLAMSAVRKKILNGKATMLKSYLKDIREE